MGMPSILRRTVRGTNNDNGHTDRHKVPNNLSFVILIVSTQTPPCATDHPKERIEVENLSDEDIVGHEEISKNQFQFRIRWNTGEII